MLQHYYTNCKSFTKYNNLQIQKQITKLPEFIKQWNSKIKIQIFTKMKLNVVTNTKLIYKIICYNTIYKSNQKISIQKYICQNY